MMNLNNVQYKTHGHLPQFVLFSTAFGETLVQQGKQQVFIHKVSIMEEF